MLNKFICIPNFFLYDLLLFYSIIDLLLILLLDQGPTRSVHPATYKIDESIIINVSIITKDGIRPSGLDVDGWLRILTSCTFGKATVNLRKTFAKVIKNLPIEELKLCTCYV